MKYILKATKQYDKQLKKCLKRGYDMTIKEDVLLHMEFGAVADGACVAEDAGA